MRALFRKLRDKRFTYQPLVEVVIHKDCLLHNLSVFEKTYPKTKIAPVLKSNAYGHGLVEVARVFDTASSIPFFVIDSYHEALVLRNEGIQKPLVLLGYTPLKNIIESRLANVKFCITSIMQLERIAERLSQKQFFHLKIDTGMHRQGVLPEELEGAGNLVKKNKNIVIESICSHFADADGEDKVFTQKQIAEWKSCVEKAETLFPGMVYRHLANTAGTYFEECNDTNVARVGLGLYGIDTQSKRDLSLKPALELTTVISSVKKLQKSDRVGYNGTFTAPHDMTVATIPVGYYEGIDHRLSDKGSVLVQDTRCPIVGRVSMNITTIDVSHLSNVGIDEEVIVISNNSERENAVEHVAGKIGLLPYEVLVRIPSTLRRVMI